MFCLNQSNFWSSQEVFNNFFFFKFLSLFVTKVSSENFLQSKFYIHECFSIWISNVFRLIDIFKNRGPFLAYSQYHSNYKSPLHLYDLRNERKGSQMTSENEWNTWHRNQFLQKFQTSMGLIEHYDLIDAYKFTTVMNLIYFM